VPSVDGDCHVPDSDKIGVWPGNEADELIFRRGTAVPWSDGEEGWEKANWSLRRARQVCSCGL